MYNLEYNTLQDWVLQSNQRLPGQLSDVSTYAASETSLCWCSPSDGRLKVHAHLPDRPKVSGLQLIGHRRPIACLALTNRVAPRLLASQAEDHVTLWNLDACAENDARGDPVEGYKRLAVGARVADSLAFLADAQYLALVYSRRVLLLPLDDRSHRQDDRCHRQDDHSTEGIWLEGHSTQVNFVGDLPEGRLLTISDDRTFQVWPCPSNSDDKALRPCHRSAVLGPTALTAAAVSETESLLFLGSAAGRLTVVNLQVGGDYRELARCSLAGSGDTAASIGRGPAISAESGAAVAALGLAQSSSGFGLTWWCLLAVTATGLHLVNAASLQRLRFIAFADALKNSGVGSLICERAIMTSCHLSSSLPVRKRPKGEVDDVDDVEEAFNIFAADANVGSSENGGRIISLLCRPTSPDNDLRAGHGNILEGFSATAPLNPESPLATVMSHSSKNEPTSSSSSPARARETIFSSKTYGGLNKQGKIEASQPVTFRSKIKSSGYGVSSAGSAKPSNFKRQAPMKPPSITTSSLSSASATKVGALHQLLLRQAGANADSSMPPSRISASIRPTDAGASHSVSRLRVLPACRPGGLVLCGAANGAAYLLEGANPGGSGLVERRNGPQLAAGGVGGGGIGGSPVACDCSLNGDRLLTANADGTCRMWNLATGRQLFEVTEQLKAVASKKTGHSSASQQLRNRQSELTHAQFYFLDKFIILALGNRIRLCVYRLTSGSEKRDDVKTYNATGGRCKLAHCIEVPECQQVTACSALNSAHSYRILAACSDRVVRLFDLNSRQPNCLATYAEADDSSTTSYAALAGAGWTFLTVAKGGPVKLWDLRVGTGPVSATHLRVSGSVRSGLSLRAGCGDASDGFACGAEDRRALFYDARNLSRPVGEVTGFTDCVTAIDCRSDTGVCVVGTNDGSVCLLD